MADRFESYESFARWEARGSADYASGRTVQFNCDDIQPLPSGVTYIRHIDLAYDLTYTAKAAQGNQTMPEERAFDCLDTLEMVTPGGHKYVDLGQPAGTSLRHFLHFLLGKRPEAHGGGGNITVAEAGTTVRVKFHVPFRAIRGINPDDFNVPLVDLAKAVLKARWANLAEGGRMGPNVSGTGNVRAAVGLIARDEYRVAPKWSIVMAELASAEENLDFAGLVLHGMIEVPVDADGLTVNRIDDAERTEFNLEWDGKTIVNRARPADLCTSWNRVHGSTRDDQLPMFETDTAPWLPIYFPAQDRYKVTQCPRGDKKPRLRVSGTDTTPRVIYLVAELIKFEDAVDKVREASGNGITVPSDFTSNPKGPAAYLNAKTAAKTVAEPGAGAFQRLPVKLYEKPLD